MQVASMVGAVTAVTLAVALAALPKEDGQEKKERHKMDVALDDKLNLGNYDLKPDNYGEVIDLSNYEDVYDYEDLASKIEVGTLPHPTNRVEELQSTIIVPTKTTQRSPPTVTTVRPLRPHPLGTITDQGLPTCLVCVCISTSVYCDDTDLEAIPPLPLETAYFYARFNHISRIQASDFISLAKLKRIDLTNNFISWVDEGSFQLLPSLQELILSENRLTSLPELPKTIVRLDARFNLIQSVGIRPEIFTDLKKLQFLHLSNNNLDYIPEPLPEELKSLHLQNNNILIMHEDTFCNSRDRNHIRRALEDIRLDGNPINLSHFPNAYFCLPRLPTGRFY